MIDALDQIFVAAKHRLMEPVPSRWQPLVSALLSIVPLLMVFPGLFALTTLLERKGLGRIQNRHGPNRVGPWGVLQPVADGLKTLTKENVVPRGAAPFIHFLAPVVLVIVSFLVYAVLPLGRNMVAVDLDAGVLFFFAVGTAAELAVFMAGWASRNKYSLLGAMRAIAQMISYEIPLILSAVTVVMVTGSLSTVRIVEAQAEYTGWIPHWFVMQPWGLAGFILFLISATAESNRSPFDLPEGESEIIAGYYIEYSGFKFALFFLAEYLGLFAVSGMAITLFLGGWHAPAPWLEFIPSWACFFVKLLALIALFIWGRGTLPRFRQDQLMEFSWKFMIPMALVNLVSAALWQLMDCGPERWLVSFLLIATPYLLLGRSLFERNQFFKRTYRFAG